MKSYKTSISCPKCGNGLKTGKIMGYGLMCQKCEEYFKISDLQKENEDLFDEGFEISAYMNLEKFELLSNKLGTLADKYNCDFFGCDDIFEAAFLCIIFFYAFFSFIFIAERKIRFAIISMHYAFVQ